jgi:hypothetical protein
MTASISRRRWPSPIARTPTTVPSSFPVFVTMTAEFEALNNTGASVPVDVRVPDTCVKRPVPPVI